MSAKYGGMDIAAISVSILSHTFDISKTDFEQIGQAYLLQFDVDKEHGTYVFVRGGEGGIYRI